MDSPLVSAKPSYSELTRQQLRLYRLGHLGALAHWDRASMMPPKGNEARVAAIAELKSITHRMRTDPVQRELLEAAEREPLDEIEHANLREIRREWIHANAVPAALVEARALAAGRCEHEWRRQRPANDWAGFVANLREVVRLAREEAKHLAGATGLSPYEAVMDRFEPGTATDELDRIFGALKAELPALIARVVQKQRGEEVVRPEGPFPVARQRELNLKVVRLLGFDFDGGRLDESTHPFCGGVPEDVRLTTRYHEGNFARSLMGTIHETGHARYNQNLPPEWRGQPLGFPRSAGIHESQSLAFEMQLGRSRAFMDVLAPLLVEAFGDQPAFEPENLHRLFTRVAPGLIRVDADECTYPLHVILRYEIERALLEGEIECDDIPALWDEKMSAYLGLDTRGNYRDGCMQDVHWAEGLFGYFPSYTLGAMYAAQWFASPTFPRPGAVVSGDDLAAVFDWLRTRIWSQGRLHATPDLVRAASGSPLDPAHFRRHLERRYT